MSLMGLRHVLAAVLAGLILFSQASSDDKPAAKEEEKKEEKKKEAEQKDTEKKDTEKKDTAKADAAKEAAIKVLEAAKAEVEKPAEKPKDADAVEVKLESASGEKSDAQKKESKEAKAAAKKKDPEPPMFRLRDGTRLAGTPELKALNIVTAYGKLTVPIAEVVRVRFAAARDTGIAGRVAELVRELSSEEFDKREEAMTALRDIGVPALEALRKAAESEDEEVKSRAEKLVSEIEELVDDSDSEESQLGSIAGDEDEVVALKFTLRGRVEEQTFALTTRYGALSLSRNDIVSVVFQEGSTTKLTFQVPGTTFAAANKWVDTKITLTQGERLRITASGQLNLENYGQTTGPEGTTNVSGNQLETHPTGSLVGKIGNGKAFLIGAEYEGSANGSGNLQLGVSLQQGQVNGQYQVEVEKENEK